MILKIKCGDNTQEVTAIRIINLSGFKFFAHRTAKYSEYTISEYQTGLRVGHGKTIKKALEVLGATVRERGGVEYFQKVLDHGIKTSGIINHERKGKHMEIKSKKCLRCGHKWMPRIVGRPAQCPHCKSPRWDTPRIRPVNCASE